MDNSFLLRDRLEHWARVRPEHPALLADGDVLSFAELHGRASAVTELLADHGVGRGDLVALLLRNRVEFVERMHALMRLGAVLVPLHPRHTAAELGAQLQDCGARWLVDEGGCAATAATVPAGVLPVPAPSSHLGDAPHTILYTSGSSGRPKGVLLTYGNHFWSAVGSALNLGVRTDDRWLACLPFCHAGGLAILLRAAIYGTTVVLHERFDPARVNGAIDAERVTMVSVVANMLQRMIEERGGRPYPPWLRCVLVGGGPVPQPLRDRCAALGVPVAPTYGLTETASQVATLVPAEAARKPGSAGRPLLGTDVALFGEDGPVPPGSPGEIAVRGPTVSPGYVGGERVSSADGWFRTGDIGRFDDEGFLYVLGRRDDMIVTGGENVHPAEVEGVLCLHPDVAEACVYGLPDERWGQVVAASVRLREGARATAGDLQEHVRGRLADYKNPRRWRLVADFPRTAAGKVARRREQALALESSAPR